MNRLLTLLVIGLAFLLLAPPAEAFCGFYVAQADSSLYNQASQVAIARHGNHTVLTMANDYQGDVSEFALVVPVPTVIEPEQVQIADPAILQRLDRFSAPRLVYYPETIAPCSELQYLLWPYTLASGGIAQLESRRDQAASALGVTVESRFSRGEYDILVLSAEESDGLETWLRQNGYRLPEGASQVLKPYIRQGMKFFVARVNLAEFDRLGYQTLRPLQIDYESRRFMLPIRLGMVNADGEQDLIVYLLSSRGRAETTNYRMLEIPTDQPLPGFVADDFGSVYPAIFQHAHQQAGGNVAFLEYAWDMSWCDPCAADPLSRDELEQAGVSWLDSQGGPPNVYLTRLHVRYRRDTFPEDLVFQETGNRRNFQGRYVIKRRTVEDKPAGNCLQDTLEHLRQEWEWRQTQDAEATADDFSTFLRNYLLNDSGLEDANQWSGRTYPTFDADTDPLRYLKQLTVNVYQQSNQRFLETLEQEAQTLADLTGWELDTIRQRMATSSQPLPAAWRLRYRDLEE